MTKPLLAIDTSTENCSAAVYANEQLYQCVAESPREHSQRLLPFVDDVCNRYRTAQLGDWWLAAAPAVLPAFVLASRLGRGWLLAVTLRYTRYPVYRRWRKNVFA